MINLVWLGTILMVGGFIWAFFKRKKNSWNIIKFKN
jgi:LPXTG-motif cell wall-anchored protein